MPNWTSIFEMWLDNGCVNPQGMRRVGPLNLLRSIRRTIDTLALWVISLTCISCIKFEEIMTPSNLKENTEISRGIGLRKQVDNLRKQISIIMDLEGVYCCV